MIPTPLGFRPLSDLHPGDLVFGRDGRSYAILAESAVVTAPAYRLTFDDGSALVAHDDHAWLTFDAKELGQLTRLDPGWRAARRQRRPSRSAVGAGQKKNHSEAHRRFLSESIAARNRRTAAPKVNPPYGTVRTTADIVATLRTARGRANHAIPVSAPLELPQRQLPLDPYVLGVWLGDGSSKSGDITTADREITLAIEAAGFPVRRTDHKANNRASTYRHEGLRAVLRRMGVLANKHVPADYLWASVEQRLALLQGLLDTDGGVGGGSAEFTNTRKALAEAVAHLVRSLGHKATVRKGVARLDGRDIGPKWTVKFAATMPVFRLRVKASLLRLATRRTTRFRYIVAAERTQPVALKCLQVAAPDHLYLAGESLIPTHNSDLLLGLALTSHKRSILFRREFPQLRALIERSREIIGEAGNYNGQAGQWRLADGRSLEFGAVQHEQNREKYQGRPHDAKLFDELPHFSRSIYRFLIGWTRTTDPKQRCRVVSAGNPPTTPEGRWVVEEWAPWLDGEFHDPAEPGELRWYAVIDGALKWFRTGDAITHGGEVIKPRSRTFIPARIADNPYLLSTGYKATLQSMPEPLRSQMLYGDFNAGTQDDEWQVIPTAWIRAAQERWRKVTRFVGGKPVPPLVPLTKKDSQGKETEEMVPAPMTCLGVDPSRGGADKTVLAPKYGSWYGPLRKYPGSGVPDGPTAMKIIMKALHELDAPEKCAVHVDVIGVGASVFDLCRQAKLNVNDINFAKGTYQRCRSRVLTFRNLRAWAYWVLREALDPVRGDDLALPPDAELLSDLTAPHWSHGPGGILLESKEDITRRIGRSPDAADALVLASLPIRAPWKLEVI